LEGISIDGKILDQVVRPSRALKPGLTDRLVVGRKVTLTLTLLAVQPLASQEALYSNNKSVSIRLSRRTQRTRLWNVSMYTGYVDWSFQRLSSVVPSGYRTRPMHHVPILSLFDSTINILSSRYTLHSLSDDTASINNVRTKPSETAQALQWRGHFTPNTICIETVQLLSPGMAAPCSLVHRWLTCSLHLWGMSRPSKQSTTKWMAGVWFSEGGWGGLLFSLSILLKG
jgi:hypothetical protein